MSKRSAPSKAKSLTSSPATKAAKAPRKTKASAIVKQNPYDELVNVSKIKLSDKGSVRHAVFLNPERKDHIKRRMDGGYMKNETAADWMLSKKGSGDVFLELKGGDVMHAIEQVCATAEFAVANDLVSGSLAALILCTEHPGFNTKMQRMMQTFATRYKGPVHTRNRSGEFVFEHVLSFNGPERL
ncbi:MULTISPECIES: hypothetical protein [unclassified Burkholderia]|uniref:hypothetical protein n=1 Tax=unclassified Burkholderia TaxID=2613784 RepID=UPI000F568AE8|nr:MULTISPECIES: hypothetical protein [unclassified Burkholderia]